MNEVRIILVSRKTILSGSASILAQSGIPISPFYIRTTTKRQKGSGPPVYVRAAPARRLFASVTLKEGTGGFSVGRNPSGRAMELYNIGSGSISTLKNGNKQSSTSRRDNALRIWVAGHSTLLDSIIGLQSCSGFMGLIRAARPRQ